MHSSTFHYLTELLYNNGSSCKKWAHHLNGDRWLHWKKHFREALLLRRLCCCVEPILCGILKFLSAAPEDIDIWYMIVFGALVLPKKHTFHSQPNRYQRIVWDQQLCLVLVKYLTHFQHNSRSNKLQWVAICFLYFALGLWCIILF